MIYFVILVITLLLQFSLGHSEESYDFATNDPKIYYNATKEMVKKFEPLIRLVISDIPNSENFTKYRDELQLYLEILEKKKSIRGLCFVKILEIMEDFVDLLTPYKTEDAKSEVKDVLELFNRNGFQTLDTEFQKLLTNYNAEKFAKHVDKLSQDDDKEVLEVC